MTAGTMWGEYLHEYLAASMARLEIGPGSVRGSGQLGECTVRYEVREGLFLDVWINPFDPPSCGVRAGRKWVADVGGGSVLSGPYSFLVARCGLSIPEYYEPLDSDRLMKGSTWDAVLDRMIADVETSLPKVLDVVTIADLEAIEGLLGGAERFRQTGFRPVSDA
jgi:hypothetical protein